MTIQWFNDYMVIPDQHFVTSTGLNNDVPIDSTVLHVEVTTTGDSITGMIPPVTTEGGLVLIVNVSPGKSLLLPGNSTASTDGYRFLLPGSSTLVTLQTGEGVFTDFIPGLGWGVFKEGTFS